MWYEQVTVVVGGALEDEREFSNHHERFRYLAGVAKEALQDGTKTEIYVTFHPHSPEVEECACVQYLTDHHPRWTFPQDSRDFLGRPEIRSLST